MLADFEPAFVRDLINDNSISPAEYNQRMEAAVRYAVAMQENVHLWDATPRERDATAE